jgi:glycerol uptake facilitator-like aquaporin
MKVQNYAHLVSFRSGGHINCAVTFGLVLAGKCSIQQGMANFMAQMIGSIAGASLLLVTVTGKNSETLGFNALRDKHFGTVGMTLGDTDSYAGPQYTAWQALIGETMMTFLLVMVVLRTACNDNSIAKNNAPLGMFYLNWPSNLHGSDSCVCAAIGFAVFIAHSILIPIDFCSINPTRSFGPAFVTSIHSHELATDAPTPWRYHYIFWIGPLFGATLAAGYNTLIDALATSEPTRADKTPEATHASAGI